MTSAASLYIFGVGLWAEFIGRTNALVLSGAIVAAFTFYLRISDATKRSNYDFILMMLLLISYSVSIVLRPDFGVLMDFVPVICFWTILFLPKRENFICFHKVMLLGVLISFVGFVLEYYLGRPLGEANDHTFIFNNELIHRAGGAIGGTLPFAVFCSVSTVYFYHRLRESKKLFHLVLFFTSVIMLTFTYSRNAYLAVALGFFLMHKKMMSLIYIGLILAALMYTDFTKDNDLFFVFDRLLTVVSMQDGSNLGRLEIWGEWIDYINLKAPYTYFIGGGFGLSGNSSGEIGLGVTESYLLKMLLVGGVSLFIYYAAVLSAYLFRAIKRANINLILIVMLLQQGVVVQCFESPSTLFILLLVVCGNIDFLHKATPNFFTFDNPNTIT